MIKIKKGLAKIYNALYTLYNLRNELDIQKMLTAKLILQNNLTRTEEIISNIHKAEFQVFSQWGDDGIIQFLVNYLEIENENFIEFGVESYHEATTRFLLANNNWKGLVMDSSKKNVRLLKAQDIYWRYDLTALNAFVTTDNINQLITENGFAGNTGLLHIDIDGNDYWIWKQINCINPEIVIVEYNHLFGPTKPYVMIYSNKPANHIYRGASLQSLCDLADEKGYHFIGCNSHGVNAYFVRKDKTKGLLPVTAQEGYVAAKAGDRSSHLTPVASITLFNTRTNQKEFFATHQEIIG